jgi:dienelactone hydrolase
MLKSATIVLATSLLATSVFAAIKTETVEYTSDGTTMEGFVAFDDAKKSSPAILVVHDWMGPSDFTKGKAEQLAKEGYVAFVADIYGKGVRPHDAGEAGKLAGKFKEDRKLMRAHVQAAFDKLSAMPNVDKKKIVAIGYCFGGTVALELARSGAPLAATTTFHGGLATPTPQDAKNIKGPVLVLHGADDPYVPAAEVKAFKEEMKNGHVKMEFIPFKGAVHAFAIPAAGNDKSKGAAYNAEADKKSWAAFEKFLKKVL